MSYDPCTKRVNTCKLRIVESIPEGLVYNSTVENMSTYKVRLTIQ